MQNLWKSIIAIPALYSHVRIRFNELKLWSNSTSRFRKRHIIMLSRTVVDAVLGISVMVILIHGNLCDTISTSTLQWADKVVILLNRLLNWLLGVPAGLKLNVPLNQFLGHFFHYHIYLWTGYLSLMQPILGYLVRLATYCGILGASYQLCFFQDIFSTLTLHIYCFYVYAARLYYLQLYAVSSLWHLFRGRKWNVLRKRMDLASYDVDQLFVGTILFTILIFLLPTTALYYVVFLGLRLLIVLVNGTVSKCVSFINDLRPYAFLLHTTAVEDADEISDISEKDLNSDEITTSREQRGCQRTEDRSKNHISWRTLAWKVFLGELIYPWIEIGTAEMSTS